MDAGRGFGIRSVIGAVRSAELELNARAVFVTRQAQLHESDNWGNTGWGVILIKALLKEKAARCFTLLAKICLVFLSSKSENAQMFSFFCS